MVPSAITGPAHATHADRTTPATRARIRIAIFSSTLVRRHGAFRRPKASGHFLIEEKASIGSPPSLAGNRAGRGLSGDVDDDAAAHLALEDPGRQRHQVRKPRLARRAVELVERQG